MHKNAPENKITNEGYWDDVWSPLGGSESQLNESDFYFGRRGLFCKLVEARLGSIAGKSVLELGGGGNNFRLLAMVKWLHAVATALDFSEEGLQIVKKLFDANGYEVSLIKRDICDWVPVEQYDFVVHWGVLEHFVDPMPILRKSAEALKPGGVLLFSMPNMEAAAAKLWKTWCPENWSKHIFHPAELIESNLNEIGLQGVGSFYFGVPFIKTADWEIKSAAQLPVDLLQKLGSVSSRIFPVFHKLGHRLVSMERGFYAKKSE